MTEQGKLIKLSDRSGFKPDVGALARDQLASARQRTGLSIEEFADRLSSLLGWRPPNEVIESWEVAVVPPGDVLVAASLVSHGTIPTQATKPDSDLVSDALAGRYADVSAIFTTRSEFISAMPPHELFHEATDIRAAGLSLNVLCQHYTETSLQGLVKAGGRVARRNRTSGLPQIRT